MLRYKADWRSLVYMAVTTALLILQWQMGSINPFIYAFSLFMAVAVAVMAHNHNHLPMWKSKVMNGITDYWLTIFYGFPAFGWIPTHNMNHHSLNNREGDYTITYRYSEKNNLFTLMSYPSISSYFQQRAIRDYLGYLKRTSKGKYLHAVLQYAVLILFIAVALFIDWKKALYFIVIPQQFALFSILVFNYVQHVHAEEESAYNHSRNFVGPMLNTLLFNNGFHTIHHERAGIHWSQTPEHHAKIEHLIDPSLKEPSFWGYIFRVYFFGAVSPRFRTDSMRLARMQQQQQTKPAHEPAKAEMVS
ncbi:MAG: fatty acid desaturase [Candidatus Kapaibacterium sp.]